MAILPHPWYLVWIVFGLDTSCVIVAYKRGGWILMGLTIIGMSLMNYRIACTTTREGENWLIDIEKELFPDDPD